MRPRNAYFVSNSYQSKPWTSFTIGQSIGTDWLLTVRPRIGWATGNFLFYGTGGVAVTRLKYVEQFTDTFNPAFETDSFSKTRVGWTIGAGSEYGLSDHWSRKGEYLYADFGKVSSRSSLAIPASVPGNVLGDPFTHTANLNVHMIRLGLNYKF